jgi:hypothetical protein
MHPKDIVAIYIYGSLDKDIYMKIQKEFNIPKVHNSSLCENYSIKLQRLL